MRRRAGLLDGAGASAQPSRRMLVLAVLGLVSLGLWVRHHSSSSSPGSSTTAAATTRSEEGVHRERDGSCNPFKSLGRLSVNLGEADANVWRPYAGAAACQPSTWFATLRADALSPALAWLQNKTVVLHGDSIDRFHLKDFCELAGGQLTLISTDHPASPPPFYVSLPPELDAQGRETQASVARRRQQAEWDRTNAARSHDAQQLTSPWVCDVASRALTLVSVFTWGLEGAPMFFQGEQWYHNPATWRERLDEITVPLLDRLAAHMQRPGIAQPDLIEINSGYWDLRRFAEEDFTAAGFTSRPYPESSPIPYTPLSPAREHAFAAEMARSVRAIASRFPSRSSGRTRDGPPILWRTLHHPPRHNYAPYPRVFALDQLSRHVISELQRRGGSGGGGGAEAQGDDLGLDERLRVNEWGALMLGQEHLFRDLLHPAAVPGSYLWADILLYELERAVRRADRSS